MDDQITKVMEQIKAIDEVSFVRRIFDKDDSPVFVRELDQDCNLITLNVYMRRSVDLGVAVQEIIQTKDVPK